ncbi:MAG: sugar transferase [Eubacteriales bacterium]|nr:sugar transferase [Eubacteriales bacterium]
MRTDAVRPYYDALTRRGGALFAKRALDVFASAVLLALLWPLLLVLAAVIRLDSPGPALFRQARVTAGAREFTIYKFRSMTTGAPGTQVTVQGDARVTKVGRFLRRTRLDELPQLFNIFKGDMTLVGTRPEVPRYVARYAPEMLATLLLPAGVTSPASIAYKDEEKLLENAADADRVYVERVLPEKMAYNLQYIKEFSFWGDVKLLFATLAAVVK